MRVGDFLCCLAALCMSSVASAEIRFTGVSFPTGSGTRHAVVADLDGDNVPDLVATNEASVNALLGNGDGTFQTFTKFAVGNNPNSIVVADLDGDDVPDLITANRDSRDVSVLLGNGDGTFQPSASFSAVSKPQVLAVADLDGDTVPDLVTGNTSLSDGVSVLLGNGDGTFQSAVTFWAGWGSPQHLVVADLNGDTVPDLVTGNFRQVPREQGWYPGLRVAVLLGNGDGSFQTALHFAAGNGLGSVAVVDLNDDTIPDLITVASDSNSVDLHMGNGDGTFQTAVSFVGGSYPTYVAVADLDGDTVPDVVTSNLFSDELNVLLGNGDATFQTAIPVEVEDDTPTVIDFDGDTIPDLVTAAGILLGNGDGTFQTRILFPTSGSAVAVADLDGDSLLDVVIANGESDDVRVLIRVPEPSRLLLAVVALATLAFLRWRLAGSDPRLDACAFCRTGP